MKGSNYISSPLNYIGGKYKLLPQLFPLFPNKVHTFVDLFCGGANVGINVNANKICLNDNLVYLIDLYEVFHRLDIEETIEYIEDRIDEYNLSLTNKEGYIKLREEYNKSRKPLDLFVLISFSFNHQIRFNNNHQFNCPFGRERSRYNPRIKQNLINFVDNLKRKNVSFSSCNFDDYDFSKLEKGDYIYADPPYLITTGTYNDGKRGFTGWNTDSELKLLSILKELDKSGIKFGLSNVLYHKGKSNVILKEWIINNGYNINYLDKDYSNCNYHSLDKRKDVSVEVLVTNYEPYK